MSFFYLQRYTKKIKKTNIGRYLLENIFQQWKRKLLD